MDSIAVLARSALTLDEANKIDAEIVAKVDDVRSLLIRMDTANGWLIMGFSSWENYLQDLGRRTRMGSKYLRRINNAALLESGSGYDLGTFKEGTIRPINDTLSDAKDFRAEDRADALELAIELAGGANKLTASIAQTAAWYIVVEVKTPPLGNRLVARMSAGSVSTKNANSICQVLRGPKCFGIEHVIAEVSDPQLAESLVNVYSTNGETWQDLQETIELSGMMPSGNDKQILIGNATNDDLIDYLNAPLRMQRYEKIVEKSELNRRIAKASAAMMVKNYGITRSTLPSKLLSDPKAFWNEIELYKLLQQADLIR